VRCRRRSPKRINKYVSKGLGRSTKSRSVVCHTVLSISLSCLGNRSDGNCPLLGDISALNC